MGLHPSKQIAKDTIGLLKAQVLSTCTGGLWADTYSIAIDSCNDRLLDPGDMVPVAQELAGVTVLKCPVLHFLDVSSSYR